MEERDGGFLFFCSQACHGKAVRGEMAGGVVCDACAKRFTVDLVSQVVRGPNGSRKYACSADCRTQVLAESDGARLAQFVTAEAPKTVPSPATSIAAASAPPVRMPEAARVPSVTAPTEPPAAPISTVTPTRAASPTQTPISPAVAPVASPTRSAVAPVASAPARELAPFHGPRKLAIFNHKGGTGKTTTTVSIAAGLAERGLKVLLVDTDSQGNVAVSFGVKPEKTLYHVLVMGLRAEDCATTVRPNLDLLPSNETLAAAELYLAGRQNRDRVLRDRLASATSSYDVVVVDCSPSLSLMNQNALVFADGILVPVACDYLSLVGVRQVIKTVKNVNSLLRHPVQIYGVLPTFYDARARICRDAVET
jgi:chromosome partitioning protein